MTDCLFCKIIAGKIPAKKIYEDEKTFVFEDIKPQAPTHVLIVPKKHIVGIDQATEADAEIDRLLPDRSGEDRARTQAGARVSHGL